MNDFYKYAIIDTEGSFLKHNDLQTLIVTEVSYAIFENKNLIKYDTYRLNYDLRIFKTNEYFNKFFKYINTNWYNTYRGKLYVQNKYNEHDVRKQILKELGYHNIKSNQVRYNIYSKGPRQEQIWLFHPECCNLNFVDKMPAVHTKNNIHDLKFLQKYDDIPNNIKYKALQKYLNINNKSYLKHHISLYEIITFGYIINYMTPSVAL